MTTTNIDRFDADIDMVSQWLKDSDSVEDDTLEKRLSVLLNEWREKWVAVNYYDYYVTERALLDLTINAITSAYQDERGEVKRGIGAYEEYKEGLTG